MALEYICDSATGSSPELLNALAGHLRFAASVNDLHRVLHGSILRRYLAVTSIISVHSMGRQLSLVAPSTPCSLKRRPVSKKFTVKWREFLTDFFSSADLLKDEFPRIPEKHIISTLRQQKTLFKTYILLEKQLRNYRSFSRFVKTPRPRNKRGVELVMIERGSQLPKELRAAKQKVEQEGGKYPHNPRVFISVLT